MLPVTVCGLDDQLVAALVCEIVGTLLAAARAVLLNGDDLLHVVQRPRIVRIQQLRPAQCLLRLAVLFPLHVQKGHELMAFHQLGAHGKYLFQLYDRQILAALLTVQQRLVKLLDRLIHQIQLRIVRLHLVQVRVRDVLLRLIVGADDPLGQRLHRLPGLIVNESQKVPGIDILLVELQALPQTVCRTGHIPYSRLIKTRIIVTVGKVQDSFV